MKRGPRKTIGHMGFCLLSDRRRRKRQNPVDYRFRFVPEELETRRLLAGIVAVVPLADTHTAPVATEISVVLDSDINSASVSAQTFTVHGMQTGQILQSPSVSGNTIALSPAAAFHPGELVQVTATSGIQNADGEPASAPFVWQFRTAASGGSSLFRDTGQRLDGDTSFDVALGDLDGDGDLDVFVVHGGWPNEANKVWLNDGNGNFEDSGQRLGNTPSRSVQLADVDGDGDLDALVANYDGRTKVWLNDGSGDFSDRELRVGGGWVTALGDLDGDGDLDAVTTGHSGARVWLNEDAALRGDSNEDGVFDQLDIVQVLQADKYDTGRPATFAEGDWNVDGVFDQSDIVEALASGTYLQVT